MPIDPQSRRFQGTLLLLATTCLSAGCGRSQDYQETPVYPTSGIVTVNGEPAAGAYILFYPDGDVGLTKGNKPFARVQDDGLFEVTTYNTADGAPAGNYRVTIIWPEDPDARGSSPDRLQGRYSRLGDSGLTATVLEPNTVLPPWELE